MATVAEVWNLAPVILPIHRIRESSGLNAYPVLA